MADLEPTAPEGGAVTTTLDNDVLTAAELAAMLKISRSRLYEVLEQDRIPHRRIGSRVRASRQAVLAWLAGGSAVPRSGR